MNNNMFTDIAYICVQGVTLKQSTSRLPVAFESIHLQIFQSIILIHCNTTGWWLNNIAVSMKQLLYFFPLSHASLYNKSIFLSLSKKHKLLFWSLTIFIDPYFLYRKKYFPSFPQITVCISFLFFLQRITTNLVT